MADEQQLAERRRGNDMPFDSRPTERTGLEALDTVFLHERYLPSAISQDVLDRNARSFEQQQHSLRLAHERGLNGLANRKPQQPNLTHLLRSPPRNES